MLCCSAMPSSVRLPAHSLHWNENRRLAVEQAPRQHSLHSSRMGHGRAGNQGQGAAAAAAPAGAPPSSCRASCTSSCIADPLCCLLLPPQSHPQLQAPRLRPPRGTASRAGLLSARLSSVLPINATPDSRGGSVSLRLAAGHPPGPSTNGGAETSEAQVWSHCTWSSLEHQTLGPRSLQEALPLLYQ